LAALQDRFVERNAQRRIGAALCPRGRRGYVPDKFRSFWNDGFSVGANIRCRARCHRVALLYLLGINGGTQFGNNWRTVCQRSVQRWIVRRNGGSSRG